MNAPNVTPAPRSRLSPREQIRQATKGAGSDLEQLLAAQIRQWGLPTPVREHVFAKDQGRKWRLDFYWPADKLAVEVDGGTHSGGRHVRGKGYEEDCIKSASAIIQGIRVMRVTGGMVESGLAIQLIASALS